MTRRVVRRPEANKSEQQSSLLNPRIIVGVAVVSLLLATLVIFLGGNSSTTNTPTTAPTGAGGLPSEGRTLGVADAPVTIVEYSDFQCPYCAQAFRDMLPALKEQYVATGKVRFEYQPVAFLGQESRRAAEAALCAEEQGKFWEMHDLLFQSQAGENRGTFSDDNLRRLAGQLELDQTQFNQCFTTQKYDDEITRITNEAQTREVGGTPHFFVNGEPVEGAVPFDYIQQVIERKLVSSQP